MSRQELLSYINIIINNIYNLVLLKIKLDILIKFLKIYLLANKKLLLI